MRGPKPVAPIRGKTFGFLSQNSDPADQPPSRADNNLPCEENTRLGLQPNRRQSRRLAALFLWDATKGTVAMSEINHAIPDAFRRLISLGLETPWFVCLGLWGELRQFKPHLNDWSHHEYVKYLCTEHGMFTIDIAKMTLHEIAAVLKRDVEQHRQSQKSASVETVKDQNHADDVPTIIAEKSPDGEKPKNLLFGWHQILDALNNLSNDDENRNRVSRLNDSHSGPIIKGGQGKSPMVDADKLVLWWNSLEMLHAESAQRVTDKGATVSESYEYGRESEIVPDIGGHVQKRRSKR